MAYLKTRPAWAQLFIFIGLAFGCFLALGMAGMLILSKITGISVMDMGDVTKWDYENPAMPTLIRGMSLIQFLSLFIIPCFLFAYFSDPAPARYLGLNKSKAIYFLAGTAVLLIAIPLVEWTGVLNHRLIPETSSTGAWMKEAEEAAAKQITFLLTRDSVKDLLLNLFFVALFAGVGEELFFRGVLQRIFIKRFKNAWIGIIATAIVFSAIHFQFYGFIPRFILGILLGVIYWYSGSLWPAIVAHFLYDALLVVVVYLNKSAVNEEGPMINFGNMLVPAIISALLVAGLVYWMKKKSSASYETVYAGDRIDHSNPFST